MLNASMAFGTSGHSTGATSLLLPIISYPENPKILSILVQTMKTSHHPRTHGLRKTSIIYAHPQSFWTGPYL